MDLTPQEWEKVKALFEEALQTPNGQRSQFLAGANAGPRVRAEAERLLASHNEAGDFLSASPLQVALGARASVAYPNAFQPGDLLAGRFRIVRFLARGGMGEVYESEDEELREHVALKIIQPELLRNLRAQDRFRREVHLAKKVTHPNVCRIFDIVRHPASASSSGESESILFVTMELLRGDTLAERLLQCGRMQVHEALPLGIQMAEGLGAAHDAGVLHRDFKPGNVVLVSSPRGMRAVITDFGLALRTTIDSTLTGSPTNTGEPFGTPAYMSPEQVEGKDLTPGSDVYSLGLVLYQMVTGSRPFEDATPLSTAVRRLREDPLPPRTLVPGLDRNFEGVVMRCLERDPRLRFPHAGDVGKALRGEMKRPNRRRTRWMWAAGVAMLILTFVSVLFLTRAGRQTSRLRSPHAEPSNVALRRSIAVLPFKNLSGHPETSWIGIALAEMVNTELGAGEELRIIPGENVVRVTSDLGIGAADTLGRETLGRLRRNLGSDVVVVGFYLGGPSGAPLRLDLRLQDTSSGETIASITEKGTGAQLDDLATRAGADLRSKLDVGEVAPAQAALVRASFPKSAEATRLYTAGLARLRVFDALGARSLLQQAISIDPGFPQAHSVLAEAWTTLGYNQRARGGSQKAYELSSGLPREQRLSIEAQNWAVKNDWEKAARTYRSLFDFFQDNVDYGLSLAGTLTKGGKAKDALTVVAALHRLPPPAGSDPRIDLAEGAVYDTLAAFEQEEAVGRLAAGKARALGARLLLARALDTQTRSYANRGLWSRSGETAAEARRIYEAAGDRDGVARVLRMLGVVLYKQGHFSDSVKTYQQALQIQQEIGSDGEAAVTLNNLATAMWDEGDWVGSEKMYRQAVDLFRRVGNQTGYSGALGNLAGILVDRGDLQGARRMFTAALQVSQEIGDKSGEGFELVNLADILQHQGKLAGARTMYDRAADLFRTSGDKSSLAYPLVGIAELLLAQGELQGAKEQFAQALKLRQDSGEQAMAARTRLEIVQLAMEEGKAVGEMEADVRSLLDGFRKGEDVEGQLDAATQLAQMLVAEGKFAEAQSALAAARQASTKTENYAKRVRLDIVQAQVEGKSNPVRAEEKLQNIAKGCRQRGFIGLQLEAELASGEIALNMGLHGDGASQLVRVRREASARGFALIARKAAAAQHQ
jgi:tetratricopeptide (TPR) repeat protein/TolB-like protein